MSPPAAVAILPLPFLARRKRRGHIHSSNRSLVYAACRCGMDVVALAAILLGLAGCGGFDAQGRNSEGVRLFKQSRYQEAAKQFQEATYYDPNNADAYYNLAATYHRIGKVEHRQTDLDQAESYYNLCLDRNADHTDCYRGLAVLLAEQGATKRPFGWSRAGSSVSRDRPTPRSSWPD